MMNFHRNCWEKVEKEERELPLIASMDIQQLACNQTQTELLSIVSYSKHSWIT
jgi:hypothetical protein